MTDSPFCIVINLDGTLTELADEPDLAGYQSLVGGYIQAVPLANDAAGFINEEGKLAGMARNELATTVYWQVEPAHLPGDYIAGAMVVTGPPDGNGDTMPIPERWVQLLRKLAQLNEGGA